ncbi:glutamine-hydrolyzing carbamoyl-phosphate synthase small subunit [Candidatus Peregrinibacteria bacterium]|jgi:carbamoyl-phosphate synthase small subunit|nr:glutamine-hydrolyzing carbamoyl-phosphate synthase small subunit [Candidatus Peregrinibacteria bacterium]MBT4147902.1 glutamine-hydrolyzing carbamoyl-phosphate synthase small subunit [Candidatus Peregrinibacteria bacterium]MBT4365813.1 glutamine-hydrolyzing carbamoyl-phosphate synthase small subunit [Candidatus Peregrinibacteria bacterium]MBT4456393.1 glutamine-hydrolyzing carbamoyl-phosphate synthase small subunit [Candidatus Peregrinibacteria bacterium]
MPKQATLVLKDGTTLQGESFGADLPCAGEVVFNTGMMGYPESFTDPSYRGQILTLTYPLIGNYGIPGECKDDDNLPKHFESNKPHIRGLIVSEYSENYSHWEAKKSLADWLKKHKIPAITGIDTRALTQKLRQHGTMLGKIVQQTSKAGRVEDAKDETPFEDPNKSNLVAEVSIKKPILYKRGPKKVIAVDCGMKHNILRSLLARNLTVLKTPWDYDFIEAQRTGTLPIEDFNGIFLSNGPGDPAMLEPLHKIIQKALKLKKPIFGICLGNQILATAAGATTYKLKFGHRAQNQPCQDVDPDSPSFKRCYVTSQNHGFAIKDESLSKDWKVWLKNLNDDTNEGIRHKTLPYFSCQFHPEATPGPTDTEHFFDEFVGML